MCNVPTRANVNCESEATTSVTSTNRAEAAAAAAVALPELGLPLPGKTDEGRGLKKIKHLSQIMINNNQHNHDKLTNNDNSKMSINQLSTKYGGNVDEMLGMIK